jgi:hypothetical protein
VILAPHPTTAGDKNALKGVPRCPFLSQKGSKAEKIEKFEKTKIKDEAYSGLGHKDGSLSFFPFSAGERSCPARTLGLQVIRKVTEIGLYLCDFFNFNFNFNLFFLCFYLPYA